METRIKQVITYGMFNNCNIIHYPQVKGWFGWKYIEVSFCGTYVTSKYYTAFDILSVPIGFEYIDHAKELIDAYIKNKELTTETNYIKYP